MIPLIKRASPVIPEIPSTLRYGGHMVFGQDAQLTDKKWSEGIRFSDLSQAFAWAEPRNGPGTKVRIQQQMGADIGKEMSERKYMPKITEYVKWFSDNNEPMPLTVDFPLAHHTKIVWVARDGEWEPKPKITVLQEYCRLEALPGGRTFVSTPQVKELTEEEWRKLP